MSARKLGRLAGLVFALAVVFGGVGAAWAAEDDSEGGKTETEVVRSDEDVVRPLDAEWS